MSKRYPELAKELILSWDLYFITDRNLSKRNIFLDCEDALRAGARVVQYREKNFSKKKMLEEALKIKALCRRFGASFIVNDNVGIAFETDADGVHVGQEDEAVENARKILGNEKIVGLTVHTVAEALEGGRLGADYLGFSPVFETSTKPDAGKAAGVGALAKVVNATSLPVVAIGGISEKNLPMVLQAKPCAVAMISAVVCADSVFETTSRIRKTILNSRQE
ncbi:MAG: thiamine phosphate synthase [Candidatus Diapherotrites archaeon]|nr:thiamine phosphate synthase [Candidatus Diapherotrites archaeon]